MFCARPLSYTIRQGDTLDQIAKQYHTTALMVLAQNLNIDPHNLKVGAVISVCPGEDYQEARTAMSPQAVPTAPKSQPMHKNHAVASEMRLVWEQHVYWVHMLLVSIAERLKDQSAVTERLLKNPADIAHAFSVCYASDITKKIAQLLTEHLQIGAALITALRDGRSEEADVLNRRWYKNADDMAAAFSGINPNYRLEEVRDMLYSHLRLTTQDVALRLSKNYTAEIDAFDKVEQEALMMADYFSSRMLTNEGTCAGMR